MAEGARLESVYAGNRIEGSNPSSSAIFLYIPLILNNNLSTMNLRTILRTTLSHSLN